MVILVGVGRALELLVLVNFVEADEDSKFVEEDRREVEVVEEDVDDNTEVAFEVGIEEVIIEDIEVVGILETVGNVEEDKEEETLEVGIRESVD